MFQPNFCIFLYPFVKKEIVALLLNRNTEAGRLLGGSTGILEHFSAALHHEVFAQSVMKKPGICWSVQTEKAGLLSCLVIIFPPIAFR